jgi:hypothetical protein
LDPEDEELILGAEKYTYITQGLVRCPLHHAKQYSGDQPEENGTGENCTNILGRTLGGTRQRRRLMYGREGNIEPDLKD